MDLYSLRKFKQYKNDWNYPPQIRQKEKIITAEKTTNFVAAIKNVVIIGQCFGLNPVLGVSEKNASSLRFQYKSWRCAYAIFGIVGQFAMSCFLVVSFFRKNHSMVDTATGIIFYVFGLLTTILFLRIAVNWPKLCMIISQMEAADPTTDPQLGIKFNIVCCVIIILAILEHFFCELYSISLAIDCEPDPGYEAFIRHMYPWIYDLIPYNTFVGIISHVTNIICTFNWNFSDIFVICMSTYLTSRLQQVSHRVLAAKDKKTSPLFWRKIREDYNKASRLVRQVDNIIGGVIFISFASNLFFVCAQLLHTFAGGIKAAARCKNDDTPDARYLLGYEHSVYFAYSFVFLMVRSLAVSLTASRVHSASLEPAFALYDMAPTNYCVEVERLLNQIHGNTVALTGLQFFYVKRGLILTIAGTIVTYELVLMQFTGISPASPSPLNFSAHDINQL